MRPCVAITDGKDGPVGLHLASILLKGRNMYAFYRDSVTGTSTVSVCGGRQTWLSQDW